MSTTGTTVYATFKPYDMTNSETELHAHAGQRAVAVLAHSATYDIEEVGPMFDLTFPDGFTAQAFDEELTDWGMGK